MEPARSIPKMLRVLPCSMVEYLRYLGIFFILALSSTNYQGEGFRGESFAVGSQ